MEDCTITGNRTRGYGGGIDISGAVDVTDLLVYGNERPEGNVLAVRVDARQSEGWFYEGGGIYRHVWMFIAEPVHISHWGTYITTPEVSKSSALVEIKTKVENNITKLYTATPNGIDCTSDYTDLGFVLLGGGALKSTFNDLMTYTRMFMNNGKINGNQFLASSILKEMTGKQISYSENLGYGLGLMVGSLDTFNYIGHSGGLTGVSSFFGYSKEIKKGVVVLCNTGAVPASSIGIAALRLANDEYPDYKTNHYDTAHWSEKIVQNTLGLYESQEGDKIIIESHKDGIQVIIGDEVFSCRIINEDLMLIQNKMEENNCRILRDSHGKAWALYRGLRIIPRK